MGPIGTPELIMIFLVLLPGLIALPMFVVSLVQCLKSIFHDPNNKLIWVLVIVLVPVLGPILWWTVGMKQRRLT